MSRRLEEVYPYSILDVRYERVREVAIGHSRARCGDSGLREERFSAPDPEGRRMETC